jgi:hypothetical protein
MEPIVTIAVAIVGVAILAVLFSKKANTAGVIQAAGTAFSGALNAATSPITGSTSGSQFQMPMIGGNLMGYQG